MLNKKGCTQASPTVINLYAFFSYQQLMFLINSDSLELYFSSLCLWQKKMTGQVNHSYLLACWNCTVGSGAGICMEGNEEPQCLTHPATSRATHLTNWVVIEKPLDLFTISDITLRVLTISCMHHWSLQIFQLHIQKIKQYRESYYQKVLESENRNGICILHRLS
jgi:hypothetical protein